MAKDWAREAAKQAFPDMEVVEKPGAASDEAKPASSAVKAERPGPSIEDLRRKYLGVEASAEASAAAEATDEGGEVGGDAEADEGDAEVDVLHVRTRKTAADPADDPGPKTVIASKKRGIFGAQG
jgi:hypothetical protein